MGNVQLTDFHEIWLEHALIKKEQNRVGEFFTFKYISFGDFIVLA